MRELARRGPPALVALALLAGPLEARADEPVKEITRILDMVVARVDRTVITLSELVAETRLVLLRTHGPERAWSERLGRDLLNAVLEAIVMRELLLAEARRLQLREVPQAEVDGAAQKIRSLFTTTGDYLRFLERMGFSPGDPGREGPSISAPPVLAAILRSERQVERFIALRVRASISVHEEDVRRCHERNLEFFRHQSFAGARSAIEQTIRSEQAERTLRTLVKQLERKASIRYAPDFKPPRGDVLDESEAGAFSCEPTRS